MSKKNTTHFTLDPKHLPRLSKKEEARLDAMRDEDIDYSDIPELGKEFWHNLRLTSPVKKTATGLRIDDDLLAWFKKSIGKGYQSHINAILRAYVFSQRKH